MVIIVLMVPLVEIFVFFSFSCTTFLLFFDGLFELMLFGVFGYPLLLLFFFPAPLACFIILRQLHCCSDFILGPTCNSFEVTLLEIE